MGLCCCFVRSRRKADSSALGAAPAEEGECCNAGSEAGPCAPTRAPELDAPPVRILYPQDAQRRPSLGLNSPLSQLSMLSDYHSACEEFSALGSSPQDSCSCSPRASTAAKASQETAQADGAQQAPPPHEAPFLEADGFGGTSDTSEEPFAPAPGKGGGLLNLTGCLTILENIRMPLTNKEEEHPAQSRLSGRAPRSRRPAVKPEMGASLAPRDMSMGALEVRECWEAAEASGYAVRSLDYMRTRQKVDSQAAIYRLVSADMYSFDRKQTHIAKMVTLSHPAMQRPHPCGDPHLPPILIINIMLPDYPPSLFGGTTDGPGHSLVYYFTLPEDFNPAKFENQKALGLLRRFVQNGREADGTNTRDRLKLIPRIINVEEWAAKGPLSAAEHKLLNTYNSKPVLTRPQHYFFHGHNYLEIDIDIHAYAFLARKALTAFVSRLGEVVFENAFVIQGNSSDELPEQVLAVARVYRLDFVKRRPLFDPAAAPVVPITPATVPAAPTTPTPAAEPSKPVTQSE